MATARPGRCPQLSGATTQPPAGREAPPAPEDTSSRAPLLGSETHRYPGLLSIYGYSLMPISGQLDDVEEGHSGHGSGASFLPVQTALGPPADRLYTNPGSPRDRPPARPGLVFASTPSPESSRIRPVALTEEQTVDSPWVSRKNSANPGSIQVRPLEGSTTETEGGIFRPGEVQTYYLRNRLNVATEVLGRLTGLLLFFSSWSVAPAPRAVSTLDGVPIGVPVCGPRPARGRSPPRKARAEGNQHVQVAGFYCGAGGDIQRDLQMSFKNMNHQGLIAGKHRKGEDKRTVPTKPPSVGGSQARGEGTATAGRMVGGPAASHETPYAPLASTQGSRNRFSFKRPPLGTGCLCHRCECASHALQPTSRAPGTPCS